jgi:hypothetical protein
VNAAGVLPAVRDLFSQHLAVAVRCSPEQVTGLLWALRYVETHPDVFDVEAALEVLDIERGLAA